MTLLIIVAGYAIGATVLLFVVYRRAADDLSGNVAGALHGDGPLEQKIKLLTAVAEYRKQVAPWYERAFSAIGVVALVTMTVAAAVQTIRAALEEQKVQQLQLTADALTGRVSESELLIESLTRSVLNRADRSFVLSEDEKRILRHRLDTLEAVERPAPAQLEELVDVSMSLREYGATIRVIERHPEVMRSARPADRVAIAEYYFLVGSRNAAMTIADEVWPHRGELPARAQQRLLVLRALLRDNRDEAAAELAALTGRDPAEARRFLDREVEAFMEGAGRMRSSR